MAVAEAPLQMAGEDLDSTMIRRLEEILGAVKVGPPSHPVKDIVLPLAVVITLCGNALLVGIAWGRFSQRMDTYEGVQTRQESRLTDQERENRTQGDRLRDLERDIKDGDRRFLLLDDYTRGRIDRLPYRPPPPARW